MPALPSFGIRTWAMLAGLAMFAPAYGVPFGDLPVQPLDVLVLLGVPVLLRNIGAINQSAGLVAMLICLSLGLSFAFSGGQLLVLAHGLVLAVPFVLLMNMVAQDVNARRMFIKAFLVGGGASILLFLLQIIFGAEALDFRTNTGFSLPPQYGRGFALFPEVSTFAVHANLTLAVALGLFLHPHSARRLRKYSITVILAAVLALLFSRSTSFLLIAPILGVAAIAMTQRLSIASALRIALACVACAVLLYVIFMQFYVERLETASASRSIQMRLASVLAGLSPLWSGEYFGVGLGENQEITRRAYDISRALDLRFGQLPNGVNSQIVARAFEEGWPAIVQFALAGMILLRGLRQRLNDPFSTALMILALGSFLSAGLVTGYRAIYTNWLWLGVPAGLLAFHMPVLRKTTPTVRSKIMKSRPKFARRA